MKKWICLMLAAVLTLCAGVLPASAEETSAPTETTEAQLPEDPSTEPAAPERDPNACGESLTWHYENGVLTVEGTGKMDDFPEGAPWQAYENEIRELQLKGSVTYIGSHAFQNHKALEVLKLGESLTEIGTAAFSGCDGLTAVELPRSFRVFGEESFSHCKNLTEFYFAGGMPKFKMNCLWDTWAKLIYPAQNPWPLEHIMQLEEAFQGRIEFLSSDGTDPYVPQPETEAPEEITVPPTTEAATIPTETPAETPVEETAEVPTAAPTEAPTQPPETVPPTTEEYVQLPDPEEEEPDGESGGSSLTLAGLIALMVISGGAALLLIGRMSHSKRKDFTGDFSEILLEDSRKTKKKPSTAEKKAAGSKGKKGGKYSR